MAEFIEADDLKRSGPLQDRLIEAGLDENEAVAKAEFFARASKALPHAGRSSANAGPAAFFVPGRLEVLGKHTDYAGGGSIVAAAGRGFCLVARPRDDDRITIVDVVFGETTEFSFADDLQPPWGHWSNYPMTASRRLARNFPGARRGVDIALAGDLPPAAGMSSSSALMIAIYLALDTANEFSTQPEFPEALTEPIELAGYLATIENGQSCGSLPGDRGVGTFGGSEDHTAILCSAPGQLGRFAYCPARFEGALPCPAGFRFAIGVSGLVAEKTGAARDGYNRASQLISAMVEIWSRETGETPASLAEALADSTKHVARLKEMFNAFDPGRIPSDAATWEGITPKTLAERLEHFLIENGQVLPSADRALRHGDVAEFGRVVDLSQEAAERLLGNQVPETIYLAASARKHGAVAASAFGAGFGGSTWAMVASDEIEKFLAAWSEDYHRAFPARRDTSLFFETVAGPAAFRL